MELLADGLKALAFVVAGIMIYLAIRFGGSTRSRASSPTCTTSSSCAAAAFFQWEFSPRCWQAVLAVLGYSVNESVVIFDRIRGPSGASAR